MAGADVLEKPVSDQKMADKSPKAFRTISEVAEEIGVPQHVLRFWESRFPEVSPVKRRGGRRYYRPEDVVLLKEIKELLYGQGFTIKGARKQVSEVGSGKAQEIKDKVIFEPKEVVRAPVPVKQNELFPAAPLPESRKNALRDIFQELCEARDILKPHSY